MSKTVHIQISLISPYTFDVLFISPQQEM